jgi:hypothetical protein
MKTVTLLQTCLTALKVQIRKWMRTGLQEKKVLEEFTLNTRNSYVISAVNCTSK